MKRIPRISALALLAAAPLLLLARGGSLAPAAPPAPQAQRQDVIRFGIDLKLAPLKLAVADFQPYSPEASPLLVVFNQVLWSDLENAGIFDLVSKSFYPQAIPGRQEDLVAPGALAAWAQPPTGAQDLAFGNAAIVNSQLVVRGFLYDLQNTQKPQILGRQYIDQASEPAARVMAHRFADAIIQQLGGGLPGIAESKIYFVRGPKTGVKDIWVMDYDGANQRPITQYGTLTHTPAVSPDGSKLAFTTYVEGPPKIYVFSLESMRRLPFQNISGSMNTTPAWSPEGTQIAYSASLAGKPEIFVANENGTRPQQLTHSSGWVDIAPAWNPKTGAQIAYVSGRGGVPQVYLMDSDGANAHRISGGEGDAVQPAWAPNGQVIAFSWTRGYAPGNYNIFLLEIASGKLVQLTYGTGANEHPWFSPDGRHIVFESNRSGRKKQIFTMLADGTQVRPLTTAGENTSPVWSAR
jgi:TolB protein